MVGQGSRQQPLKHLQMITKNLSETQLEKKTREKEPRRNMLQSERVPLRLSSLNGERSWLIEHKHSIVRLQIYPQLHGSLPHSHPRLRLTKRLA